MPHIGMGAVYKFSSRCMTVHNFSHFVQRGQVVAGVRGWPFNAMHGAGLASTFT